jgi:site-specific DNA-cytosine methylase
MAKQLSPELEMAASEFSGALSKFTKALSDEIRLDAPIPYEVLEEIISFISQAKMTFSAFSSPLTPTDRRRLIGTGFKNQGFIERALASAQSNPSLLPNYINIERFREDVEDFLRKALLDQVLMQFEREASDAALTAGDIAFRNALAYYNAVKEAAKQRVPGAESEYNTLKQYFKRIRPASDIEPSNVQVERDVRSLLQGTKEGRIVVENENPNVSGGKRKVVDEVHSGTASMKETIDSNVKE